MHLQWAPLRGLGALAGKAELGPPSPLNCYKMKLFQKLGLWQSYKEGKVTSFITTPPQVQSGPALPLQITGIRFFLVCKGRSIWVKLCFCTSAGIAKSLLPLRGKCKHFPFWRNYEMCLLHSTAKLTLWVSEELGAQPDMLSPEAAFSACPKMWLQLTDGGKRASNWEQTQSRLALGECFSHTHLSFCSKNSVCISASLAAAAAAWWHWTRLMT